MNYRVSIKDVANLTEALEQAADIEDQLAGKLTDASGQTTRWRGIYANEAALPNDGQAGDFAITLA